MQRAAVSIASNIAEGYERTPKEFARFLSIAIGSCSELRTQLHIAKELQVVPERKSEEMIDETKQLNRMMRALAKAQLRKGEKGSEGGGLRVQEEQEIYAQSNLNPEP